MKVCHVTSIHNTKDERIFYAECRTLKQNGYDVHIVGPGNSFVADGIEIHGYGNQSKTIKFRLTKLRAILLRMCFDIDAEIYHLHDPELLTLVKPLVKRGKKVIFDSHEDYPKTLLAKEMIPVILRKPVSCIFAQYEKRVCKRLSGYIACYHWTKDRIDNWCDNTALVFNFPSRTAIDDNRVYAPKNYVAYAGGITAQWMHDSILKALKHTEGLYYRIAGDINDSYGESLRNSDGWINADYCGRVDHAKVYDEVYSGAIAGMALLDYIPQCLGHKGNLSNTKLFEYMAYGLPVVCTDFDLWKEVVEGHHCGICVNPHDVNAVKEAIVYLSSHPDEAHEMGQNGIKAIRDEYNWEETSKGLFKVYNTIEKGL